MFHIRISYFLNLSMKNLLSTTLLAGALTLTGCQSTRTQTAGNVDAVLRSSQNTSSLEQKSFWDVVSEKISLSEQEERLISTFQMYANIAGRYDSIHDQAQKHLCQMYQKKHCGFPYLGEQVALDRKFHDIKTQLSQWLSREDENKQDDGFIIEKTLLENSIITLESTIRVYNYLTDFAVHDS